MSDDYLDFRSDTVTRPTPQMRAAMAEAPVDADPHPDQIHYNDCLMSQELTDHLIRDLSGAPAVQEPLPVDQAVGAQEMMHGAVPDADAEQPMYDACQMTEELFDQQIQQMSQQALLLRFIFG